MDRFFFKNGKIFYSLVLLSHTRCPHSRIRKDAVNSKEKCSEFTAIEIDSNIYFVFSFLDLSLNKIEL